MMNPVINRSKDLVENLTNANDSEARLAAIRSIKNSIIGNKRQKLSYVKLGAVQLVLNILEKETDPNLLVQAAQAVGSFATSPDGVKAIIDHAGDEKLLQTLQSSDARTIEASLRALRLLFKSSSASVDTIFRIPNALDHLVSMLSSESPHVAESAATILAKCCTFDVHREHVINAGAIPPLLTLLSNAHKPRQEAALEALSSITAHPHSEKTAVILFKRQAGIAATLLQFTKHNHSPHSRFMASLTLAHLIRDIPMNSVPGKHAVEHAILAVLVHLLSVPSIGADAVPAIIILTKEQPLLQRAVADADAVPRLAELLLHAPSSQSQSPSSHSNANMYTLAPSLPPPPPPPPPHTTTTISPTTMTTTSHHGCTRDSHGHSYPLVTPPSHDTATRARSERHRADILTALGMLCADNEDLRRQLVQCSALPTIASCLSDPCFKVRAAACSCFRGLSRSAHLLCCTLGMLGDITSPLLRLTKEDFSDVSVASEAAATLANMAVDYSSVKEMLLDQGGVSRFIELASSEEHSLRLHGIWALSSVVYMASSGLKEQVMMKLPWTKVEGLLFDDALDIQEKTALFLRNLVYNSSQDAETVLKWSENQLLVSLLLPIIAPETSPALMTHALYTIVNIASGNWLAKDAILETGWLLPVLAAMDDEHDKVREAAVWAVINLSRSSGEVQQGSEEDLAYKKRMEVLKFAGVEQRLKMLVEQDECLAVSERAGIALLEFTSVRGEEVDIHRDEEEDDQEEVEGRGDDTTDEDDIELSQDVVSDAIHEEEEDDEEEDDDEEEEHENWF